jgi:hypothetical protein
MTLRFFVVSCSAALTIALASAFRGNSAELTANGSFDTGDFSAPTVANQAGGSGSEYVIPTASVTPLGNFSTPGGPPNNNFVVVGDQMGLGTHALGQAVTVAGPAASVVLSFGMFVNDCHGGPYIDAVALIVRPRPTNRAGSISSLPLPVRSTQARAPGGY